MTPPPPSGPPRRRRAYAPAPLGPDAPRMARNRRCVSTYTPELGAYICARIAAGERREAICAHPDMPSPSTLRRWTQVYADFGRDYANARAQAQAGEIVVNLAKAARQRASRTERDGGRKSTYTAAVGREICRRLIGGETPRMIGADPPMPSVSTIYYWLRAKPGFQRMYAQARELMAEARIHQAWDIASTATAETAREARLQFDVIRWQVALMAPAKYRGAAVETAQAREPLKVVIRKFVLPGEEYGVAPAKALPAPDAG